MRFVSYIADRKPGFALVTDGGIVDLASCLSVPTLRALLEGIGIADIVSYASAFLPLNTDDVIVTGAPVGVGFSRKPPSEG